MNEWIWRFGKLEAFDLGWTDPQSAGDILIEALHRGFEPMGLEFGPRVVDPEMTDAVIGATVYQVVTPGKGSGEFVVLTTLGARTELVLCCQYPDLLDYLRHLEPLLALSERTAHLRLREAKVVRFGGGDGSRASS